MFMFVSHYEDTRILILCYLMLLSVPLFFLFLSFFFTLMVKIFQNILFSIIQSDFILRQNDFANLIKQ